MTHLKLCLWVIGLMPSLRCGFDHQGGHKCRSPGARVIFIKRSFIKAKMMSHLWCTAGCCSAHSFSLWPVIGTPVSPPCASLRTSRRCRKPRRTAWGRERWGTVTAGSGYVWTFSPAWLRLNSKGAQWQMKWHWQAWVKNNSKSQTGCGDLPGSEDCGTFCENTMRIEDEVGGKTEKWGVGISGVWEVERRSEGKIKSSLSEWWK